MAEVSAGQPARAIGDLHGGKPTLAAIVQVHERFDGRTAFYGVVHVFELTGHPAAKRAYAWSSPVEGSDRRKFYAVLHQPPVTSPAEAVRASVPADSRATRFQPSATHDDVPASGEGG